MEGRHVALVPVLVSVDEQLPAAGIERAYGFGQVAIRARRVEVDARRVVVDEYPGKDEILIEVVVGAAADHVEIHEVLEVGDLAPLPALGHVGRAEELHGRGERRVTRLRQTVAQADADARQYVHDALDSAPLGEGEHDTAAIRDEYLECHVLQEVAARVHGAYLVEVPLAVEVVRVGEQIAAQRLERGVLLVDLEVELVARYGQCAAHHAHHAHELALGRVVDGSAHLGLHVRGVRCVRAAVAVAAVVVGSC